MGEFWDRFKTHLLIAQVQELVKLDSTVRERAERPLLLKLGGEGGISDLGVLHTKSSAFLPFLHTSFSLSVAQIT